MRYFSRMVPAVLAIALVLACISMVAKAQEAASDHVSILGAVNKPGDYQFQPGMSIKEALEIAGGLAANADYGNAVLLRANRDKIIVNLKSILEAKEIMPLYAGDTLSVAVRSLMVKVEGEARYAGSFELKSGMTAASAVALAGGGGETADLAGTVVMRNGQALRAGLDDPSTSLVLQANDVVSIPKFTVAVTGEVTNPGTYGLAIGSSDNLEGLIRVAGGLTQKADLKHVRIAALQGIDRPTRTVDATDPAVRSSTKVLRGDVVYLPSAQGKKKSKVSMNQVYQASLILYTLFQIFH